MTRPLSDELRWLEPGDRWEYDLTGAMVRDGNELRLAGQVIVTVERRPTARGELGVIVFEQQRRLIGATAGAGEVPPVPTGLFYFIQDPERLDVAIVGDNMGPGGEDRFADAPQVFYPGRWSAATGYRNVLDFGPAGRVENWLAGEGPAEVAVPLGRFMAWRAAIGSDSPQFGRVTGVDYWTPQLGAPIQFEMTVTGPDGNRNPVSTQARMRATNVLSR